MMDAAITDPVALVVIALGLAMGGILKGATGAGMPVIAVPVIAVFSDIRLAVVIIVIPNFIINLQQLWRYRHDTGTHGLTVQMVVGGMGGAVLGTMALVSLPQTALMLLMAAVILVYIGLRLARPDFRISPELAHRTAWMVGGVGGVLQGALGISSPAAITFLSALKLPRPNFISTASAFFSAMCVPQVIVATGYGLIDARIALLGLVAIVPLMAAVRLGDWIGKRMSAQVFDRVILILLAVLACKQIAGALL